MKITCFIKNLFKTKPTKYLKNQARDIKLYGEKCSFRSKKNVPNELIDEITPFRRRSEKPTNLSDKKWFIQNFEDKKGKEYLPIDWDKFSEQEKADFIVADRYSSLVANKIMRKIKDEPVEHSFRIYRGEITGYAKGNENEVRNPFSPGDTKVHNHPTSAKIKQLKKDSVIRRFLEHLCPELYTSKCGFSGQDMMSAVMTRERSFLIDSNGHKYLFEPKPNPVSLKEQIISVNTIKELFEEQDVKCSRKHAEIMGTEFAKIMKKTGATSEHAKDEVVQFYDDYGKLLSLPLIGKYRDAMFKSKAFKTELLDNVGKYTEL